MEKAAWHKGVDVSFQACAWADSNYCASWAASTYRDGVGGSSLVVPEEQFILFADNLHGQTTDEFKSVLMEKCNTLLWLLPTKCTDEVQPVDAGYGRLFKVYVGKFLDKWLLEADHVELWESNKLTASQRRVLITQWVGEAAKKIDVDMGVEYRRRLFEKTGLAMTADGSDDDLINLEGVEGVFSFMDMDVTPEPLEDVLPVSPAPADEEHPAGSSDEDDDSDGEEGGGGGTHDDLATIDNDDDLDEGEEPLPLEIPAGYSLESQVPAALTAVLIRRSIVLRRGIGWLQGTITRQAQVRTRHLYDYRVFLERDGSTHSVKLPLAKYSVDGSAGKGSWALLKCPASTAESDQEEEEDEEDEEAPVRGAKGKGRRKRKRNTPHATRSSGRDRVVNVRLADQGV